MPFYLQTIFFHRNSPQIEAKILFTSSHVVKPVIQVFSPSFGTLVTTSENERNGLYWYSPVHKDIHRRKERSIIKRSINDWFSQTRLNKNDDFRNSLMKHRVWLIYLTVLTLRRPRYFANRKRPREVDAIPLDFCLPVRIFFKIFLMGMFSGWRNPTVIMKKFYLYCMTLKIKVKHLFAWHFLSPVVYMIQTQYWCRF